MSEIKKLGKGYHGFSNSSDASYKKVIWGKKQFEEIVKQYNRIDQRDVLLQELLTLLKSEKRYVNTRM